MGPQTGYSGLASTSDLVQVSLDRTLDPTPVTDKDCILPIRNGEWKQID